MIFNMKSLYWDRNKIELIIEKKKLFSNRIYTKTKTFMFKSITKILISYCENRTSALHHCTVYRNI